MEAPTSPWPGVCVRSPGVVLEFIYVPKPILFIWKRFKLFVFTIFRKIAFLAQW